MRKKVLFTIYIPIDHVREGGEGVRMNSHATCVIMSWHCGTGCVTDFQFQLHVGYQYGCFRNIGFQSPFSQNKIFIISNEFTNCNNE